MRSDFPDWARSTVDCSCKAADADDALQVIEAEADDLDLLLCDVVLPGRVSGPEFAGKAKELYPHLKVVFMSGYASDLYAHDNIPGFNEALLTKPFRRAHLTSVIRDALTS